jgi:acetyltransferase AlgX (SGNH hydrolase-like protein)
MANTDEFDYGDEVAAGLVPKLVAAIVLAVFGITIFGTALTDTFFPAKGIQLVGAELVKQQQLEADATLMDGTLARRFEDSLREHSRVRSTVLPTYAFLKYAYFDEAPSGIVVGDHHWLFLEKRISLSTHDDQLLADGFVSALVALERRLLGNDIELITLPLLRKAYVAHEYLPKGHDARRAVDDAIIESMQERGLKTVDLRALYAEFRPEEIYFELDTHWTPHGARLAAEEMTRVAGTWKAVEKRLGQLETAVSTERSAVGMGTLQSVQVDPAAVDLDSLGLRVPETTVLHFGPAIRKWRLAGRPDTPNALAGTSFSTAQQTADLLTHYSGERVFDGAIAARPFMWNVSRVLQRYGDSGKLKRLYFETPIAPALVGYSPHGAYFTSAVGKTFELAAPARLAPLQMFEPGWMLLGFEQPVSLTGGGRQRLIQVPSGRIAHSGDGVVCARLTGEVTGGEATLRLTCGESTYLHDVGPGSFDFTLPILAPGPTDSGLLVFADPARGASLRIEGAELVHQPVGRGFAELRVEATEGVVDMKPRRPLQLGRRAALIAKVSAKAQRAVGVTVRVHTSGREEGREYRFDLIRPGGSIALDLGSAAGESLIGVVVTAEQGLPAFGAVGVTGVD